VLEDIVGAGFPFVGGAILFAAGLVSFSINNKKLGLTQPMGYAPAPQRKPY
jgi:hypothetical protein